MSILQKHPSSIVHPKAIIGKNVMIGAFSVIGRDVLVGDNCVIEEHVILKGNTKIGTKNHIGSFTTIGFPPQDFKHDLGTVTKVQIGNENVIQEYVAIHAGTSWDRKVTSLGSKNHLMTYCHLGHDSSVEDGCTFGPNTIIGGHVKIGSGVVTGGVVAFHQFCRVGDFAMIGGVSAVVLDIPPFMMANGQRAHFHGINKIGLERNGFSKEEIQDAQRIFKVFFRKGLTQKEALERIQGEFVHSRVALLFLDFIKQSVRGVTR